MVDVDWKAFAMHISSDSSSEWILRIDAVMVREGLTGRSYGLWGRGENESDVD